MSNKNTLVKITEQLSSFAIRLKDGITPFKEEPSTEKFGKADGNSTSTNQIHASDLFSMFTADIIKEQVVFTR